MGLFSGGQEGAGQEGAPRPLTEAERAAKAVKNPHELARLAQGAAVLGHYDDAQAYQAELRSRDTTPRAQPWTVPTSWLNTRS